MDERIKEKLINRAKTNPYVNFLGIDFTVIEEGRVEAHMPLHDEQRQKCIFRPALITVPLAISSLPQAARKKDIFNSAVSTSFSSGVIV